MYHLIAYLEHDDTLERIPGAYVVVPIEHKTCAVFDFLSFEEASNFANFLEKRLDVKEHILIKMKELHNPSILYKICASKGSEIKKIDPLGEIYVKTN